jgi:hypothetical protein
MNETVRWNVRPRKLVHMQAETIAMIVVQAHIEAAVIAALYATYQMCYRCCITKSGQAEDVAADQPAHNNNSKTRSTRPVVQTGVKTPGDASASRGDHTHQRMNNMSAQCHGRRQLNPQVVTATGRNVCAGANAGHRVHTASGILSGTDLNGTGGCVLSL